MSTIFSWKVFYLRFKFKDVSITNEDNRFMQLYLFKTEEATTFKAGWDACRESIADFCKE